MCQALIKNHPNNVMILNELADLYYADHAYDQAMACYKKVVKLEGLDQCDVFKANIRIGWILYNQGKFDDALPILISIDTIDAQEYAAKIWIDKGNHSEALIIYRRLLRSDPENKGFKSHIEEINKVISAKKVEFKGTKKIEVKPSAIDKEAKEKCAADYSTTKKTEEETAAQPKTEELIKQPNLEVETVDFTKVQELQEVPSEPAEIQVDVITLPITQSAAELKKKPKKLTKSQKNAAKWAARKLKSALLKQFSDGEESEDQDDLNYEIDPFEPPSPVSSSSSENINYCITPASESAHSRI